MKRLRQNVRELILTDQPASLDLLLAGIYHEAKLGNYAKIDDIFDAADCINDTPELLVAICTATLAFKRMLAKRVEFIKKLKNRLLPEIGEQRVRNIFNGLE